MKILFQDEDTGLIHLQNDERRAVYDPFLGKKTFKDCCSSTMYTLVDQNNFILDLDFV